MDSRIEAIATAAIQRRLSLANVLAHDAQARVHMNIVRLVSSSDKACKFVEVELEIVEPVTIRRGREKFEYPVSVWHDSRVAEGDEIESIGDALEWLLDGFIAALDDANHNRVR
jgi:hypothetical protein